MQRFKRVQADRGAGHDKLSGLYLAAMLRKPVDEPSPNSSVKANAA
jgi:hypothetical protein